MPVKSAAIFLVIASLALFGCAAPAKKAAPESPPPVQDEKPRPGNVSYTVKGKKYFILSTAKGYDEAGLATWYGGRFHGRKTASGEIFDMNKLTAAHKTLPLGSRVSVENPQNGRSVIVRINDRGPFSDTHIIDLSRAAARAIGMKGSMRLRVKSID